MLGNSQPTLGRFWPTGYCECIKNHPILSKIFHIFNGKRNIQCGKIFIKVA